MPDITPWWLDQSLPPPAFGGDEPTTAPWGSPSQGGPLSYPYPSPTPYPTPNFINTVNAGPGLTFSPGNYPSAPAAYDPYSSLPYMSHFADNPVTDPSGAGFADPTLGFDDPFVDDTLPPPPNTVNAGPGLEFVPDPNAGALPPPPRPGAVPRPAWTQNPPGSGPLGPRDLNRIGFDPRGGYGDPGNYNPLGPGGPPGTFGIVNPSSPAGGGSFFGGHSNPSMWLPGSTYNLGASGGNLSNPFQIYRGIHSTPFRSWLQKNHPGMSPSMFWNQFTASQKATNESENSGAGLSGAGRPMTTAR